MHNNFHSISSNVYCSINRVTRASPTHVNRGRQVRGATDHWRPPPPPPPAPHFFFQEYYHGSPVCRLFSYVTARGHSCCIFTTTHCYYLREMFIVNPFRNAVRAGDVYFFKYEANRFCSFHNALFKSRSLTAFHSASKFISGHHAPLSIWKGLLFCWLLHLAYSFSDCDANHRAGLYTTARVLETERLAAVSIITIVLTFLLHSLHCFL